MRLPDDQLPEKEGDWCWYGIENGRPLRIAMMLPIVGQTIIPILPRDNGWNWDGDLDKPSITPSIRTTSHRGEWHGFMIKGELKSC